MAGKVLQLDDIIIEDQLGTSIANKFLEWDTLRQRKKESWKEVREYVYATDTTQTSNSKLPWTNTTTIPKICQIRDNLFANYMAAIFPKKKWLSWAGNDKESNSREKREAVVNYMAYVISHPDFEKEVAKLVLDYIDYGNVIAGVDWVDETQELPNRLQTGYVGPVPRRHNPLDVVFNPLAPTFSESPKIVRSIVSLGEVKKVLEQLSRSDEQESYEELWQYIRRLRSDASKGFGVNADKTRYLQMDGFSSFEAYLQSDYCELLTFYGDIYDSHSDTFYQNHLIIVVDRHKVIHMEPNASSFGRPNMVHAGWRPRQDNLWAMGPLDNLIGLQYRLDHVENLKADVFDLLTYPPLKIKGYVEDFNWGPMERIFVGDDGDVEMMSPPFQVLQANIEIDYIARMMEEMAGSPKEAMGFRTPGEKTAYEVQRLENAASRIFQAKIVQFEKQVLEPLLNMMLETARRKITSQQFRVFDDEFKAQSFMTITSDDLKVNGSIKPMGARHFAERAEIIQNLSNFYSSAVGQDEAIKMHFSSVKQAQMVEELLAIGDYDLVTPYVRLSEQADAQRIMNNAEEAVNMEQQTATGLGDDFDMEDDLGPATA